MENRAQAPPAPVEPRVAMASFPNRAAADKAATRLRRDGYHRHQVAVLSVIPQALRGRNADVIGRSHVAGLFFGLISGIVWGGIVGGAYDYFSSSLSMRIRFAAIAGAIIGGILGLILGAITGMGIRRRDRRMMDRHLEGATSMVVLLSEGNVQDARASLRKHGGVETGQEVSLTGRPGTAAPAAGQPVMASERPGAPPRV